MKKVVFLLVLFIGLNSQQTHASTTEIYQFDDYQIQLTYTSDNQSNRGYELAKIGSNPFSTMLFYEHSDIRIADVLEIDGNHVFYGYIHQDDQPTYYDGFMVVLSPSGEEIDRKIIDYELLEEIIHVFPMDNVIMVVLSTSTTDERRSYIFDHYTVISYSYNYEMIDDFDIFEDNDSSGERLFGVKFSVDDKVIAKARASSKKKAEEKACQRAYFAFQDKIDKK